MPFDTYGGGFYETSNVTSELNVPSGVTIRDRFNFIPTTSALDVGNYTANLTDADYKNAYVGANPPTGSKSSPFINFATDWDTNSNTRNKAHISFSPRNGDWLVAELEGPVTTTDCSYVCNSTDYIIGSNSICGTNNYSLSNSSFSNYTWAVLDPNNLVILTQTGSQVAIAQNNINQLGGYITLQCDYGDNGTVCGNVTKSKTIWVGKPNIYTYNLDGTKNFMPGVYIYPVSYNTEEIRVYTDAPGATYSWDVFPTSLQWYSHNNKIAFVPSTAGNFLITPKVTNSCGESIQFFPVDVGDSNYPPDFLVYPNPASSSLNIFSQNNISMAKNSGVKLKNSSNSSQYFIYNMNSNIVDSGFFDNTTLVDVSNLKKGVYVLKIKANDKDEYHRIIIQ
ncbi:T9SS type A sorting domain-containing protein [Polaribacter sp.]|nr:T9SS type A sorting domain-containing protein [Polaribacter sp.]